VLVVCALVALVVAVAVLPWLVPAVPRLLGDALGGGEQPRAARVQDPPVPPPTTSATDGPTSRRPAPADLTGRRLRQAGAPVRLAVRRLSVDSAVVPISGQSGTLLPPSDARELGWWREGAVPGAATGTAVLTGHTVHTGGGAFDHLGLLVPGDTVVVRTAKGRISYEVSRVRVYGTAALARHSRDVFRLAGPGRLVLITCSDWNGSSYDTNTVVSARPVARG
jgi:LPXTG-site transpeptidase (sortase) family protein